MRSATAINLQGRITQMFWLGNAVIDAFIMLLGAVMAFGVFGYDPQLAALTVRTGATLAAIGAALTLFSLWKARSTSSTR
jgi:hypothetical protein